MSTKRALSSDQQLHVRQELRQRIYTTLQFAKDLPAQECLQEVKTRLLAIQAYCETIDKTFIVVEERITCDQYDLGGYKLNAATLFRGPSADASVAICVTDRGSLLHRTSPQWQAYRNVGDIGCNIPLAS
ncbi:MAG: hypothetical protein HC936_13340 [Leptolyngbyaceae cyanobacterium SU_3_3]|nr:hypothetical protein [Leptolyngbyaceae cyanobacterium SU_3_3]NJR49931.1 hypothetical protein [Leptolyngbyaceae cyanobacterium CSU_1_3]